MSLAKGLVGIGVDTISWKRAERFLAHHSIEFAGRLLAPSEQATYQTVSRPVEFFARCFAAKEAFFKASEGSWMGESDFRNIEVLMEGKNRFRIRGGVQTKGQFFEVPDGMGARVVVWRNSNP